MWLVVLEQVVGIEELEQQSVSCARGPRGNVSHLREAMLGSFDTYLARLADAGLLVCRVQSKCIEVAHFRVERPREEVVADTVLRSIDTPSCLLATRISRWINPKTDTSS